jgi:hypothetical protein
MLNDSVNSEREIRAVVASTSFINQRASTKASFVSDTNRSRLS